MEILPNRVEFSLDSDLVHCSCCQSCGKGCQVSHWIRAHAYKHGHTHTWTHKHTLMDARTHARFLSLSSVCLFVCLSVSLSRSVCVCLSLSLLHLPSAPSQTHTNTYSHTHTHTHTLECASTQPLFPSHTGRCSTLVTATRRASSRRRVTAGCTGSEASPSPTTAASSTGRVSRSRARSCTGSATRSERREPEPEQGGTVWVRPLQLFFPEIHCSFSSKVCQTETPFCIYSPRNCGSHPGL